MEATVHYTLNSKTCEPVSRELLERNVEYMK
jgi:hypothetical protein